MDLPIDDKAFSGRGLAVRTASLFKGPRMLIDGAEVRGKRLRFSLRDNSGRVQEIRLKSSLLDPIPKVEIEGHTIELARALTWYEYAWMGLPVILVFTGGGLGAFFGAMAVYTSSRIFRSDSGTAAKYGSRPSSRRARSSRFLSAWCCSKGSSIPLVRAEGGTRRSLRDRFAFGSGLVVLSFSTGNRSRPDGATPPRPRRSRVRESRFGLRAGRSIKSKKRISRSGSTLKTRTAPRSEGVAHLSAGSGPVLDCHLHLRAESEDMPIDLAQRKLAKAPWLGDWREDNVNSQISVRFEQTVEVAAYVDP